MLRETFCGYDVKYTRQHLFELSFFIFSYLLYLFLVCPMVSTPYLVGFVLASALLLILILLVLYCLVAAAAAAAMVVATTAVASAR